MSAMPESNQPNTPISTERQNDIFRLRQNGNLPKGPCNYRDSTQQCGCRQYFDETYGRSGDGSLWYCMCDHHACFHDQVYHVKEGASSSQYLQAQARQFGSDGIQRLQARTDDSPNYDRNVVLNTQSQSSRGGLSMEPEAAFAYAQSSLPDTLPWNQAVQPSQPGLFPPIPPQCLFPSQERIDRENERAMEGTQSSASGAFSQKRPYVDVRANSFLPLQTKNQQSSSSAMQQIVSKTPESRLNSTTALVHHKDQADTACHEREDDIALQEEGENILLPQILHRQSTPITAIRRDVGTLSTVVKAHGERLDSMENVSFSLTDNSEVHGKLQEKQEDMEERVELVELRQDELDGRLTELEKSHDDESRNGSSFTSLNAAPADSSFVLSLKTQISDLQTALFITPSHERPWEVEVVFLPFGSSLKGIWSTIEGFPSQSSRRSSMAADDWVQSQLQPLSLKQSSQPGSWEGVASEHNEDFLVARSCNRNSRIYARLKSRGCVRIIQICGPSFKDVEAALLESFEDLPEELSGSDDKTATKRRNHLKSKYHGLQSFWVPLRKLHRDSRLRFLHPYELISQTLWTTEFLKSSVVMRAAGNPILFVTQSQGYTQHLSVASHWTWPKLRLLPRVDLNPDETGVGEADAKEACWKFDNRFDSHESVHSSFASIHSLSIRQAPFSAYNNPASRSDHFSSAAASPVNTPITSERKASPVPSIRSSRTNLRRTTSLQLIPLQERPSLSKRKTSYYSELHSKPSPQNAPAHINQKRRRISRSPSRPRNTPRWDAGFQDVDGISVDGPRVRGTTPFAYATPHSNDYEFRAFEDEDSSGSTTQNADSELPMNEEQPEEKPWEGVQDGTENDDIDDSESDASDSSDAPSEYPSTQPLGPIGYGREGIFQLHVDEEDDYDGIHQRP